MTEGKEPNDRDSLEEEGYDVLEMVETPFTFHTKLGDIRIVPQDDGYLVGVRQSGMENPPGFPEEDGFVTVTPKREDGTVGMSSDDIAGKIGDLLADEFENVPEDYVQRVLIEVEEPIAVTYYDEEEVLGGDDGV